MQQSQQQFAGGYIAGEYNPLQYQETFVPQSYHYLYHPTKGALRPEQVQEQKEYAAHMVHVIQEAAEYHRFQTAMMMACQQVQEQAPEKVPYVQSNARDSYSNSSTTYGRCITFDPAIEERIAAINKRKAKNASNQSSKSGAYHSSSYQSNRERSKGKQAASSSPPQNANNAVELVPNPCYVHHQKAKNSTRSH
ncbi:hypothetical protein CAEBREN_00393 [Caenorhabditis brenneri]|uniref:Uncharacterized protein n=1 Tax=Caenorhabditis brenneri TaxID=135651 RepID=G0NZX6_CAEBE|nr:hypothetical protein CAEBREN_00393 [Caenorhabditis brenneri]